MKFLIYSFLVCSTLLAESDLVLRDCDQNIRRAISNPENSFIVRVTLTDHSEGHIVARSKSGTEVTAPIDDSVATFNELQIDDWSFCSEPIKSISYETSGEGGGFLFAGLTGAGALAGVVSFGSQKGEGSPIDSTENLTLEGGAGGENNSPSASGNSQADFARECLNEEEIEVMSRMN